MSPQETAARMTEKLARDLVLALKATPLEKLDWKPEGLGRSIVDQLTECVGANVKWTCIFQERAYRNPTEAEWEASTDGLITPEALAERLIASADTLATALRALDGTFVAMQIPGTSRTWAEACFHPYWNMAYHEGQLAFIQTLYGDTEEHADSGPSGE
ncbi:hypothetical protein [Armatimonas sp.]|uniref:hypothetical protein n=1 Tax=Armatimonas sp. TaxID=1872638 RepID=UPI003752D405